MLHFLSVQTAVSISVINFERPSQFVLQFSTKNEMHRCHVFHEVDLTILRRQQDGGHVCQSYCPPASTDIMQYPPLCYFHFFLDSYLFNIMHTRLCYITLFVSKDRNRLSMYAASSSVEFRVIPKILLNSCKCRFPLGHSLANLR